MTTTVIYGTRARPGSPAPRLTGADSGSPSPTSRERRAGSGSREASASARSVSRFPPGSSGSTSAPGGSTSPRSRSTLGSQPSRTPRTASGLSVLRRRRRHRPASRPPTSRFPISRGTCTPSPTIAGRRCSSTAGPPGEAAATTCRSGRASTRRPGTRGSSSSASRWTSRAKPSSASSSAPRRLATCRKRSRTSWAGTRSSRSGPACRRIRA